MTQHAATDARREEILRATHDIIKRDGVAALRVEDVAARACVAKGLVYYYFKNRDRLIDEAWSVEMNRGPVPERTEDLLARPVLLDMLAWRVVHGLPVAAPSKEHVPLTAMAPMTLPDAAVAFGVSLFSVRRWIREGRLGVSARVDGCDYINPVDLDALLRTRKGNRHLASRRKAPPPPRTR